MTRKKIYYVPRKTKLKKYAKIIGLKGTRAQGHTFETIAQPIAELRKKFPKAGVLVLRTLLLNDFGMRVSKYVRS